VLPACSLALFTALGGGAYAAGMSSSTAITWTNATVGHGWMNVGRGDAPAGYAKDSLGSLDGVSFVAGE
jgi:hypothetical protein